MGQPQRVWKDLWKKGKFIFNIFYNTVNYLPRTFLHYLFLYSPTFLSYCFKYSSGSDSQYSSTIFSGSQNPLLMIINKSLGFSWIFDWVMLNIIIEFLLLHVFIHILQLLTNNFWIQPFQYFFSFHWLMVC